MDQIAPHETKSLRSRIRRLRLRKRTIQRKHAALGGDTGILGAPKTAKVEIAADGKGRFRDYQNGSIYWFPSTGVHEIHGAIFHKWNALQREAGWLGYPLSDEIADGNGVACHSDFQNGSIYWTEKGAHVLRAEILKLWKDLGGENGRLGYPTTDEARGPYAGGVYQTFQNGSSIYWDSDRGAYEVLPEPKPLADPPAELGMWNVALYDSKVVGIHAALLHTGRVLFFSHGNPHENLADEPMVEVGSAVLDPKTGEVTQQALDAGVICSGHTFLSDGQLLACGSERKREGVHAIRLFTPTQSSGAWQHVRDMDDARWYPTCCRLPDGKVLIIGGHRWFRDENTANSTYEILDVNGQTAESGIFPFFENCENGLFPAAFVLPSGELLIHAGTRTCFVNPKDFSLDARTIEASERPDRNSRTYDVQGTAVLLPLSPDSTPPYRARVMLIGGGGKPPVTAQTTATDSCEILDMGESPLAWKLATPMSQPRVMPDSVLLPDGNVLVTNGSSTGKADSGANPVMEPELYDVPTGKWTTLNPMRIPRLYHSVALLLPDGRVLTAGTDSVWHRAAFNEAKLRVEIFAPPYLLRGARPIIHDAPLEINYGMEFEVRTTQAENIRSIALLSPGSVTHSFNSNQRYVGLSIAGKRPNSLSVLSPPNAFVAPPGFYMLFVVNEDGVPSSARIVRVTPGPAELTPSER